MGCASGVWVRSRKNEKGELCSVFREDYEAVTFVVILQPDVMKTESTVFFL